MLFHKTRSNLALKYWKRPLQNNCVYLNRSNLKGFLFNTETECFIASNEKKKHVVEMGAWEVSIFKVWKQSRVPKLEGAGN